jgi:hypothetical protein
MWSARGDEGMFWLWTNPVRSRAEAYARYSFYAWLGSCVVLLPPIGMTVAIWIWGLTLLIHSMVLSYRDWIRPRS